MKYTQYRGELLGIATDTFLFTLGLYVFLFMTDLVWPGIIVRHVNINLLLVACVVSGALMTGLSTTEQN